MTTARQAAITGVFPVLPTPFDATGAPDANGLATLVRYLLRSGVDGMTFPGVASEVATLSESERADLTALVIREVAGRVPVVAGVSSNDAAVITGPVSGSFPGSPVVLNYLLTIAQDQITALKCVV